MTHPYIIAGGRWAFALRTLSGYPAFKPVTHTCMWTSSGSRDIGQIEQLAQMAVDSGQDIVHIAFADLAASEPVAVSMIVRHAASVEWLENVTLYAASEDAPIQFLARDRRWFFGPRHTLTSGKLPPAARRARGEAIAMHRWRTLVTSMRPVQLEGSAFVRAGERIGDAVPLGCLDLAA